VTARILERIWIGHWAGTLAMAVVLTAATLAARNSGAVVPQPQRYMIAKPPLGGARLSDDEVRAVAAYVFSIERGR
jgi:hypothetical protein